MSSEKNLWETLKTDLMLDVMRLCFCDEKYINEKVSDFEMLREWCRIFSLIDGHKAESVFLSDLREALGISVEKRYIDPENARIFWEIYNTKSTSLNCEYHDEKILENTNSHKIHITDEKNNKIISLEELINRGIANGAKDVMFLGSSVFNDLKSSKSNDTIHVYADLDTRTFFTPDRYHAQNVLDKIINGEKYNKKEKNIFLCQIVCEILCQNKSNNIHIHVYSFTSVVAELAEYLAIHNMNAIIHVLCDIRTSPLDILRLCLPKSRRCNIIPEIIVMKNDNLDDVRKFIEELSYVYPIGMARIKSE